MPAPAPPAANLDTADDVSDIEPPPTLAVPNTNTASVRWGKGRAVCC